jgi:hypothetical protein
MNKMTRILLSTAAILALGCPSDDTGVNDTGDTGTDSSTSPTTTNPTTTDPSATMTSPTTTADTSGTDTVSTTVDPDSSGTMEESSSSTTVDPSIFVFNDTPPENYTNLDRKGFPAVNTGTQILGDKDAYNLGTPEDDAALTFIPETLASLGLLHWGPDALNPPNPAGPGLDDDLATFGITPCEAPQVGFLNSCALQGAPAVVPDVLKIDTDLPAGFHFDPVTCGPVPNGRGLADPVIDIILAVLLVDLSQPIPDGWGVPCPTKEDPGAPASIFLSIGALGGLSLNPPANDVPFETEFPYLAPAHE